MGEQSESIGVALEVGQVVPFALAQVLSEPQSGPFAEVGLYGFLARVAKRRIAQVVGQAGCRHDVAEIVERVEHFGRVGIARAQAYGHLVGKRASYTRHLEAVGQTVVYKYAAGEGEDLCLVLQTAEGRGKHEPVKVALKVVARSRLGVVVMFKPKPFVGNQLVPFHGVGSIVRHSGR